MPQQIRTALLICNGEMASPEVLHALASQVDAVVCADGGANAARAIDLVPDTIIGDFDSITEDTRAFYERAGVSLIHLQRQDDTDFEKALILLREQGVQTVAVCGLTGKLLDHTLGNFSILLRYLSAFRIVLFDPHYRVDIITSSAEFSSRPGDRISIVPLTPAHGVHYTGLRYQLEKELLAFGVAEGTCNESTGDNFAIGMQDGVLLIFRELQDGMLLL
ncbi:MAG: thiamine diphosphokinase [Bacteroidota bacterium]